ncbi:MAG: S1 RNA-binding domain-containing protein, partial [Anaerolineae bacterium]|nr:S1 RNA-binding domain-containing protein [Anaerolineae bacterium]
KGKELDDWQEAERLLEADEVLELQVSGYNSGGVTVAFNQLTGFVPASHLVDYRRGMSDQDKSDWLRAMPGKVLRLKLLEVSQSKRRLVLSQRKAERVYRRKRREELLANLSVGDVVSGKISSLAGFGAFVDIGGADGLVHISEISHEMVNDPKDALQVGEEVRVRVIKLDRERERIGLSIKQLLPSPWDDIYSRLFAGQVVSATIVNVAPFGAFARIEQGLVGLIHISRLSDHSVSHPSEVVAPGDTVQVRVVGIDAGRQRIALSMRDVPQDDGASDEGEGMETVAQEPAVVIDWVEGEPEVIA